MSRPEHPSRTRRVALAAALTVVPAALAPSAASADYTTANTWSGGGVPAARDGQFPAEGALVSLVTGPTTARLYVVVASRRCVVRGALRGTTTPRPGGVGDLLSVGVSARGTRTSKAPIGRSRAVVSVTLSPAAPGVLAGTVTARGTNRFRGRTTPCSMTRSVRLTSRAGLTTPFRPQTTDPGASRAGIVSSPVSSRLQGAIALSQRSDRTVHGAWLLRLTCSSGSKRTTDDFVNTGRRFRIRADGTFRGRESAESRRVVGRERRTFRFVATISGRIDPDGVARGRVAVTFRNTRTGYRTQTCRTGSVAFAAAP